MKFILLLLAFDSSASASELTTLSTTNAETGIAIFLKYKRHPNGRVEGEFGIANTSEKRVTLNGTHVYLYCEEKFANGMQAVPFGWNLQSEKVVLSKNEYYGGRFSRVLRPKGYLVLRYEGRDTAKKKGIRLILETKQD